jgi:hypothetical protein
MVPLISIAHNAFVRNAGRIKRVRSTSVVNSLRRQDKTLNEIKKDDGLKRRLMPYLRVSMISLSEKVGNYSTTKVNFLANLRKPSRRLQTPEEAILFWGSMILAYRMGCQQLRALPR